jgi:acyl carrier protein
MNARAARPEELGRRVGDVVLAVAAGRPGARDPVDQDGPVDLDGVLAGLDSVTTVDLLIRLETEFGIAIPASAIVRANFASVSAVCDLVRSAIKHPPSETG